MSNQFIGWLANQIAPPMFGAMAVTFTVVTLLLFARIGYTALKRGKD